MTKALIGCLTALGGYILSSSQGYCSDPKIEQSRFLTATSLAVARQTQLHVMECDENGDDLHHFYECYLVTGPKINVEKSDLLIAIWNQFEGAKPATLDGPLLGQTGQCFVLTNSKGEGLLALELRADKSQIWIEEICNTNTQLGLYQRVRIKPGEEALALFNQDLWAKIAALASQEQGVKVK